MKNLLNFFFSFDKLMKEKLVILFFWLAIIVFALAYFSSFLSGIRLGPLAWIVDRLNFIASFLLGITGIRLLCEVAVAIFRINNNLSPDKGKSETANIDPLVEARKAAEATAARAKEVTKSASEKASAATKTAVDKTKNAASSAKDNAKSATGTATSKASTKTKAKKTTKTAVKKTKAKTATAKKAPAKKAPAKKAAPKKTAAKSTASKKSGAKALRDAQGRLLKKDGTPRAKPGPKKSS